MQGIFSSIDMINKPIEERIEQVRNNTHYREIQEKIAQEKIEKGIWVKSRDKSGQTDFYLDVAKLSTQAYFTTVKTHEGIATVPLLVKMIMGEKISIKDKIEEIIEAYAKAVIQSTSYNLMMSRIAGMKMASLAFILSVLGVPVEELKRLKKKALEDAASENLALMEENTYNGELLEIVGSGSKKKLNTERSVLNEIQKQLLTQAKRLSIDDYYTQEKLLEMKIRVNKEILSKFLVEEQNIQYELDYYM
jgi:hypothetical protein